MRDLDTVTETVGRRLTLMFGEQLNFVSGESAWLLGECASREIVAHLWTKGIITAAAQDNEVESLVDQLVSAVSQIEGEDESGVLKERTVKHKMSNYLSKAKIVSGSAWEKLNGAGSSLALRFQRAQATSGPLMVCFIVLGLWWRKEMVIFIFYFFVVSFVFLC